MTTWFVSRHPGALEWALRRGITTDEQVAHVNVAKVGAGDTVIGTLPVQLVAVICEQGAHYFNLSLDMPAHWRGRELSADDLDLAGARLEEYVVSRPDQSAAKMWPT